jgi:hypothetical protein
MSDRTDLAALFKKWNIDYIETTYDTIKLVQGFQKVGGHYGLFVEFRFDKEDNFTSVDVYDEDQLD